MPSAIFLIKPNEQKPHNPAVKQSYTMNIVARQIYTNDLMVYVQADTVANLAKFGADYPKRRTHSGEIPEEEADMWERLAFPENSGSFVNGLLEGIESKNIHVERRKESANPVKRN